MFSKSFPKIKIEDWVLRSYSLDDIDLVKEASEDPLIPLITSIPNIFTKQAGAEFIERQLSRFEDKIGYAFVIAQRHDNKAIGAVYMGLENIEDGRASIGYWLLKSHRGKKIASFVIRGLADWINQTLKIPRLELYVEPWNHASIKTAESAGFSQEGIMRSWQSIGGERKDMVMMSLILDNP